MSYRTVTATCSRGPPLARVLPPANRSTGKKARDAVRLIDHFVLVAGNLSDARQHYRRMGFNVAPDGVHPFGTHNANMYFRDGPMIETLSIENPVKYAAAVEAGNTFVRNDAAFRAAHGDGGLSHVVVTSTDADRDHDGFLERGVSGGDIVSFSRQFEQPDGSVETIAAKLAFATHSKAQSAFYFTCEDIVTPAIDRSSLLDHENGALGANHVISCSREPLTYVDFLRGLFEPNEIRVSDQAIDCIAPNGRASIVTPEVLAQDFGMKHSRTGADLLHRGLVFRVTDLQKTEALFAQNHIPFERHNERLVTQLSPEPGPFFSFEQRR